MEEESMEMERFVTSVDDSLGILHEHEHRRHIIPCFSLSGKFGDEIQSSHVDRWMNLVTTKHYVRRLVLDNEKIPIYKFLPAAFDVGSIVELSLENCILNKDLIQEDTRFSYLKKLELKAVDLNELVIGDLLSRCPSLETLVLGCCKNIEYLELVDFPKLRRVFLVQSQAFKYKIELASLKALRYVDSVNPLDLEAICCSNLELNLCICRAITEKHIQELILRFPCLSDLALRASTFGSIDGEIKLSSNQLKSLRITGYICAKNINIDAPNLLSYHSHGKEIPPSFGLNSVKLDFVHHSFPDVSILHTKWFLKLREYLAKFSPARTLALRISRPFVAMKFSSRELRKEKIPPPPEVMDLVIEKVPWPLDYTTLIDGLLWSCHPIMIRMLRVNNSNSIKLVYKILTERQEKPQCCRDSHIKCWRHYLKSAKHKDFCGTKDGRTIYSKDSAVSLLDFEEVREATFELQW